MGGGEVIWSLLDTYNWWEMSTDSSQEECQHWALSTLSQISKECSCVGWECLVKISNFSPLFSYVMNTYPNEKKEGGDFWHELEKAWELVLQKEERRRGWKTGSTRNAYQFLPWKHVGKSISTFSKCQHLSLLRLPKDLWCHSAPPHHTRPLISHLSPSSITPIHHSPFSSLFLFLSPRHFICREHHDRHGLGEEEGEEEVGQGGW